MNDITKIVVINQRGQVTSSTEFVDSEAKENLYNLHYYHYSLGSGESRKKDPVVT